MMKESHAKIAKILVALIPLAGLIVAILNFLVPFSPIGPSPFAPKTPTFLPTETIAEVTTASTENGRSEPEETHAASPLEIAIVDDNLHPNATATITPTRKPSATARPEPSETAAVDITTILAASNTPELQPNTPVATTEVTATRTPQPTLTPKPIVPTVTPVTLVEWSAPLGNEGIRRINHPWEQDGVSLTARSIEVMSESNSGDVAARVWFRLVNKTGQRLLVDIDWTKVYLEDSQGARYMDWDPGSPTSVWIETGDNFDFDRYYSLTPRNRSRVPAEVEFVQVVVEQFSRISNARWQYDINPRLQPIAMPAPGTTKAIGEVWEQEGLALRLTNLDVWAESEGSNAAARAWFEIVNQTNQELLIEIDFGRFALIDSFGRRFGDWDGGGLFALSLDAGETLTFDRYYSDRSGSRSRITRGASFVLMTAEGVGRIAAASWLIPLDFRLSSRDTQAQDIPLKINQSWEQNGISLTARTIEVRAGSEGGDVAARVWFRMVNKTGQRLLSPIDWSNIYLEDGLGTRYGDWEGGGLTSVWVESGGVYDFDRYFAVTPGNRSRIPANAGFVQVVIDEFMGISNARWQYDINSQLQPSSEPTVGTAKAVGEVWEQDGLALRLTNLEVWAESEGGDAAARAWFELVNTTNQAMIVEIDFGHLALIDSFGRRFGDWEGSSIYAITLEAGEMSRFDRYYGEMFGRRSRITTGSQFVLLTVDSVAGIGAGAWRLDIIR